MFIVMTTCGSGIEAKRLATLVLKARLAACVQMIPIQSAYWWQGKITSSREVLLLIKTKRQLYPMLEALVRRVSRYEVPVVEGWELNAMSRAAREWVKTILAGTLRS